MTELPSSKGEEENLPVVLNAPEKGQLERMVSVIASEIYPDFKELEENEREARIKNAASVIREDGMICVREETELFAGPLPHPSVLAGYENVVPGCAKQIIDDMLSESSHRRKMEEKSLDNAIIYTKDGLKKGFITGILGMLFGCVIILAGLYAGGTAVVVGTLISGSVIGGGSITMIVKKLVDGKQPEQAKQTAEKGLPKPKGTDK